MSKSRFTDVLCIVIILCMVLGTVLFMNADKLGVQAVETDESANLNATFTDRDLDGTWDGETAEYIDLSDIEGLTMANAYELDGDLYLISKGTYVLSGSLEEGKRIIVDADAVKIQIVLDGVTVTTEDRAGIYVKDADKVFLTLAEGTENSITVTGELNEEDTAADIDAALFSQDDLTINGSGTLTVTAPSTGGIKSKDDLVITGGTISVTAGGNGITGRDSVRIADGILTIDAGNDGIKTTNDTDPENKGYILITGGEFHITAEHDGIQAQTELTVEGGDFDITTGGGSENAEAHQGEMPGGMGGFGGGMGRGGMGRGSMSGEMPELPEGFDGEMPEPPEGFDGEMPEPPEGFNGEMPEPPEGAGGEMPEPEETDAADDAAAEAAGTENTSGEQEETASDSSKGLKAGVSITVSGGTITLDCCDDAIHSDGSVSIMDGNITLQTGDDGIHADNTVTIDGGTVMIEGSYEGVEGYFIYMNGGDVSVKSEDDGFNASASGSELAVLNITGGTVYVNADGDGLDSNGDLIIDGGLIYVDGPTNSGNGALDSGTESGGDIVVNGGTILALGSSGMAETFSTNSTQYSVSFTFSETFAEGNTLTILDEEGNTVMEYSVNKSGNSVIFSSAEIEDGKTYTASFGEQSQEAQASIGEESSGFGMGGFGGGMGHGGMGRGGMNGFGSGTQTEEN